ncbi:MAG: response regulator [Bdellovibrionaceae bacterium]|nr:response regulator [Pseudobdellovibrionaceae bacterium]
MQSMRLVALVDDEEGITEILSDFLNETYEVVTFSRPQSFLEWLDDKSHPQLDILVSDFKMPGMNGLEMINFARSKGHDFGALMLSGFLDKDTILKAVSSGVTRIIEKPCTPTKVLFAIEDLALEVDINRVYRNLSGLIDRMREYFSAVSLLLSNHLPTTAIENFALISDGKGHALGNLSFDEFMREFDNQLKSLARSGEFMRIKRERRSTENPDDES